MTSINRAQSAIKLICNNVIINMNYVNVWVNNKIIRNRVRAIICKLI